jgi:CheY-like chemotaxis protein
VSIDEEPSLKVTAAKAEGEEAGRLIRKHRPHLAILDIDMPNLDGLAVAKEITRLNIEGANTLLRFVVQQKENLKQLLIRSKFRTFDYLPSISNLATRSSSSVRLSFRAYPIAPAANPAALSSCSS